MFELLKEIGVLQVNYLVKKTQKTPKLDRNSCTVYKTEETNTKAGF